jgi:glycosyltransferase involved in cell wall biosynthesis
VFELARELPRLAPEHEFYYYADRKAPFEISDLPGNVTLTLLPWHSPLSSLRNEWLIGRYMNRDRVDVAHSPGNFGPRVDAPHVLTLHDTLNVFPLSQHLKGFSRRPRQVAMMAYLGRKTRASLSRASRVITVSQHARADIVAKTGYPETRIDVTYEAPAEEFRVLDDRDFLEGLMTRYGLKGQIILGDGIKNPQATIEAYRALPERLRKSAMLVFFGREYTPRPAVAAALADSHVRFISQPSTAELVGLMNLATVFAFPSWYEGFGLPLVESMQCGLPIVASSRGSIPEIVGDAGLIFDLEQPGVFAKHLQHILEDDPARYALKAKCRDRARQFSWRETALRTLRVYELVAGAPAQQCA